MQLVFPVAVGNVELLQDACVLLGVEVSKLNPAVVENPLEVPLGLLAIDRLARSVLLPDPAQTNLVSLAIVIVKVSQGLV